MCGERRWERRKERVSPSLVPNPQTATHWLSCHSPRGQSGRSEGQNFSSALRSTWWKECQKMRKRHIHNRTNKRENDGALPAEKAEKCDYAHSAQSDQCGASLGNMVVSVFIFPACLPEFTCTHAHVYVIQISDRNSSNK